MLFSSRIWFFSLRNFGFLQVICYGNFKSSTAFYDVNITAKDNLETYSYKEVIKNCVLGHISTYFAYFGTLRRRKKLPCLATHSVMLKLEFYPSWITTHKEQSRPVPATMSAGSGKRVHYKFCRVILPQKFNFRKKVLTLGVWV